MVEVNNIRLIALIEAINNDSKFKIVNFLAGFKVKKIVESGIHKQDSEQRYCFTIEKEDIFQIPYSSNIKDISVIVGENGTGKTTIINKILRGNLNTYLVLEKNNEFCIYSSSRQDNISLQYLDETLEINYVFNNSCVECPYIIKFSNSEEFSDGNIYTLPDAIDASRFKNIYGFDASYRNLRTIDNKRINLLETISQIRFVEEFKHKISEFVDYTNKGVEVTFDSDGLPFQSQHLHYLDRVNKPTRTDSEKEIVNFRLIRYFSVLINYIIEMFYSEDNTFNAERLIEFHLLRYEDEDNLRLQYQSISVDGDRFLPTKYNIVGLREVVPNSLSDCCEDENWIKLWHLYFILHLYIKLIEINEEDITKKYAKRISFVLEDLHKITAQIDLEVGKDGRRDKRNIIDKIKSYNKSIANVIHNRTSGQDLENFFNKFKAASTLVAKSLSYTYYFELSESDDSLKYKLLPEMVWDDLKNLIPEKIELLQKIKESLYELNQVNTDFELLSLIIENLIEVDIPAITDSLQMKWIGLSSGELGLLKSFSNLNYAKIVLQRNVYPRIDKDNFLLLLDEVDLGLHPEWQRKWVYSALPIIERIFEKKHLQLVITSHSPILLSDIYKENVIFLTKDNDASMNREIKKTFGQNIYTLYKSSFFLNNLMGEYAYKTIEDTVVYLSAEISEKTLDKGNLYYELEEDKKILTAKKIIDSVGDIIIANQLKELFERAFPEPDKEVNHIKIDQLKYQINKLQKELEELERGERK